jgi:hypothetical protein
MLGVNKIYNVCQSCAGRKTGELRYFQLEGGFGLNLDPGCSLAKFYRWILKYILGSLTNSKLDTIASSSYKTLVM